MAITAVKYEMGGLGPFYLTAFKCTHDGSATTYDTGYGANALAMWIGSKTAAADQTFHNDVGVCHFGGASTSGYITWVFVIHP